MKKELIKIFKIEDVEDGVCKEYYEKVGVNIGFIYKNMQATIYFNKNEFKTDTPGFDEIKNKIAEVINK